ncbi:MAG: methyltransferase domain-containing protein [Allosphingosinicella sp.]
MPTPLHEDRLHAVREALRAAGARTVLDLGCGDGALFVRLAADPAFARIAGVDISEEALRSLERRLSSAGLLSQERTPLLRASFTEPDPRLAGYDAAILVETIEHVDPARLPRLERTLFESYRPATVVVTTPNVEYNDLLGVPRSRLRHPGHRFEWTREQFRAWGEAVAARTGYAAAFRNLGGEHPRLGGPSQMTLFRRAADAA